MSGRRFKRLLVGVAVLLAAVLAATARADGDPASDYLAVSNTFLPYYGQHPSRASTTALTSAVETVYVKHFRIKVAVIAGKADLGAVPGLFNMPGEYASFLGAELQWIYIGPLLIVMPNGFGIYDGGRSTAAEQAVLKRQSIQGSDGDALTLAAAAAVRRLLAAGALKSKDILAPIAQPSPTSPATRGRPLKLNYRVYEDSGYAAVQLQVVAGGRAIASFKKPLRRTTPSKLYSVQWTVPSSVGKNPLFCMTARDGSGNRSPRACAPIQIG